MFTLRHKTKGYWITSSWEPGEHIRVFPSKEELLKHYDCSEIHLPDWVEIVDVELAVVLPD